MHPSRAPARTSSPSTSPASGSCSSATASTAVAARTTSTASRSRSTAIRRRCSTGSCAGSWITRSPARNSIGARARALRNRYGRNKGQFWVEPDSFLRMFVLNTLTPAVPEQPEAEAGRELRCRPCSARSRTRWEPGRHPYRPVPDAEQARLPGRAHLPASRARSREGAQARQGTDERRKGSPVRPGHPRCDRPGAAHTAERAGIGLEVEIKRISPGVYFSTLATPSAPFDIAYAGLLDRDQDPADSLAGDVRRADDRPTWVRQLVVLQLGEVQPPARSGVELSPARLGTGPMASSTCRSRGTRRRRFRTPTTTRSRS